MTATPALRLEKSTGPYLKRPWWVLPWLAVSPGLERVTLGRFVAWAYARGHDRSTVLGMALAVNREWSSSLSYADVSLVVSRTERLDAPRTFRVKRRAR